MTKGVQDRMVAVEKVRDDFHAALYRDADLDAALALVADDCVLQNVVTFTHDRELPWLLPGLPATGRHLEVLADIRAGRTDEQKHAVLARITTEVGQILGTAPEEVWVYICDIPGANIAEYGRPLPDPGQEDPWFDALPDELRETLTPLR